MTLTKEWLQKTIAQLEEERDATPGAVNEDAAMALAAMKLALASLEADCDSEPVAFINGAWKLAYYRPPKELGLKIGDKLFAAPPAPLTDPERQELKSFAMKTDCVSSNGRSACSMIRRSAEYCQNCNPASAGVIQYQKLPLGSHHYWEIP
ncbi:hypothetical protein ACVXG8_09760 [Escherichia coli]